MSSASLMNLIEQLITTAHQYERREQSRLRTGIYRLEHPSGFMLVEVQARPKLNKGKLRTKFHVWSNGIRPISYLRVYWNESTAEWHAASNQPWVYYSGSRDDLQRLRLPAFFPSHRLSPK